MNGGGKRTVWKGGLRGALVGFALVTLVYICLQLRHPTTYNGLFFLYYILPVSIFGAMIDAIIVAMKD